MKYNTPYFIEDKSFLTDNQINYISEIIESEKTPFYFAPRATKHGGDSAHFVHHAITRPEDGSHQPGIENSSEAPFFKNILNTFCNKHSIKYQTIYRAVMNITFPNDKIDKVPAHIDHDFPHRQLLIYLNNSDGNTVILDYEENIFKSIEPEQYKGIMFDSTKHYHFFPTRSWRGVILITFI